MNGVSKIFLILFAISSLGWACAWSSCERSDRQIEKWRHDFYKEYYLGIYKNDEIQGLRKENFRINEDRLELIYKIKDLQKEQK